ncbi:ras-related protein Rab-19 isoform X1 [Larus michahellis]|uniref:ras-related protein Rab-19 isoform X1 n=1 Tax=Larus michahellis TaxID=119627 RepID=UPI003D9B1F08
MPFSSSGADDAFDYLFKIILIGDSNVGKTCVVHRFKTGQYNEKQQNTIGVDFTVRSMDIDGKKVKIQVWDTAGQERFRTITQSYYRSAHGAILAYDLTRRSTFESIPHWIHEIEKLLLLLFHPPRKKLQMRELRKTGKDLMGGELLQIQDMNLMKGNKSDSLDKRQVLFEDACTLAEKHGLLAVLETSAKEAQNIEEVFTLMAKELIARNTLQLHGENPPNSIYLDSRPVIASPSVEKSQCLC